MKDQPKRPKPILCLDFDGTIHSYSSGWCGPTVVADPPVEGALRWIWEASKYFQIAIYSSRSSQPGGIEAMKRWFWTEVAREIESGRLKSWRESTGECVAVYMSRLSFPTSKPSAFLTIDDRAIRFRGSWIEFDPESLLGFRPWYQRQGSKTESKEGRGQNVKV